MLFPTYDQILYAGLSVKVSSLKVTYTSSVTSDGLSRLDEAESWTACLNSTMLPELCNINRIQLCYTNGILWNNGIEYKSITETWFHYSCYDNWISYFIYLCRQTLWVCVYVWILRQTGMSMYALVVITVMEFHYFQNSWISSLMEFCTSACPDVLKKWNSGNSRNMEIWKFQKISGV